MSDHTISLAFSVLHHYLKLFAEKQEPHLPLPSFPSQFKQVDISPFLSQAEHLVLGKQPELKQSNFFMIANHSHQFLFFPKKKKKIPHFQHIGISLFKRSQRFLNLIVITQVYG